MFVRVRGCVVPERRGAVPILTARWAVRAVAAAAGLRSADRGGGGKRGVEEIAGQVSGPLKRNSDRLRLGGRHRRRTRSRNKTTQDIMKFCLPTGRPIRRILALGGLVLIAFILLQNMPDQKALSLDPDMKLHQFGLVSEDGVIETNKVEKVDKEGLELEQERRRKKKESDKQKLEKENARNEARARRKLSRQRKAQQRKKGLGTKSNRRKVNVDDVDLVGYNVVKSNSEKDGDDTNKPGAAGVNIKVDDFIENGEQESDLAGMSTRAKQVFLRKVANRKQEMKESGQA